MKEISCWEYAMDITGIIISLLTLLIAFNIFKRFSFKNKVLDKQFETVAELIEVLQNWTIAIRTKGLQTDRDYFSRGWRVKFFDFKNLKNSDNHKELFFDEKLLFTSEWFDQNPLLGLDDNPFMPKKIAEKITEFRIGLPTKASSDDFKKVTIIDLDRHFDKSIKIHPKSDSEFNFDAIYNPYDKCFKDFKTFSQLCADLNNEIENWLSKYDASDLNLK